MRIKKQIGIFHYNKNGLGYITYNSDGVEGVIPLMPTARDGAFDGDTVEVMVAAGDNSRERRFGGKITRVISRSQDHVIGTLFCDDEGTECVQPTGYIPFRIPVKRAFRGKYPVGDLVKASLCPAKTVSALRVVPERSYGKSDTYESALELLFDEMPFGESFSPEAALQARELMRLGYEGDDRERRVFETGLFCPVQRRTGRSDVAFGIVFGTSSNTVYLHFIDLDALIPKGSPLDIEAEKRFRTVRARSESRFSLLPVTLLGGALNIASPGIHPAITLCLEFSQDGRLLSFDIGESLVSNVTPVNVEDIERCLDGDHNVCIPFKRELQYCANLSSQLVKKRIADGGVAVLPNFIRYYENNDSEDTIDSEPPVESRLAEILIEAGHALGRYFAAKGVKALYDVTSAPKLTQNIDVPLYCRPLMRFCDVYADDRFAAAANNTRETAEFGMISASINFAVPSSTYSHEPMPNLLLGLSCYAPVAAPTHFYEAFAQQRIIKAVLKGETPQPCDIDIYNKRNEMAVNFDRTLRLISALKYYSRFNLVPVTVVAVDTSITVQTSGGLIGELAPGPAVDDAFTEGMTLKARIKSISFDKKQIVFTL